MEELSAEIITLFAQSQKAVLQALKARKKVVREVTETTNCTAREPKTISQNFRAMPNWTELFKSKNFRIFDRRRFEPRPPASEENAPTAGSKVLFLPPYLSVFVSI